MKVNSLHHHMTTTQRPASMALFELPSSNRIFSDLQKMIHHDVKREHTSWLFSNGTTSYLINYGFLKYWVAQDANRKCILAVLEHGLGAFKTDPEFISIKQV